MDKHSCCQGKIMSFINSQIINIFCIAQSFGVCNLMIFTCFIDKVQHSLFRVIFFKSGFPVWCMAIWIYYRPVNLIDIFVQCSFFFKDCLANAQEFLLSRLVGCMVFISFDYIFPHKFPIFWVLPESFQSLGGSCAKYLLQLGIFPEMLFIYPRKSL